MGTISGKERSIGQAAESEQYFFCCNRLQGLRGALTGAVSEWFMFDPPQTRTALLLRFGRHTANKKKDVNRDLLLLIPPATYLFLAPMAHL